MRRAYKFGAAAAAPSAALATSEGYPTEGDVSRGIAATVPGPFTFYMLVEAIVTVIERAGLVPSDDPNQFRDAVLALIPDVSNLATQVWVRTQIAGLVDSAPGTLDTLDELAAALGDDPNFRTTILNMLALKAPLVSPVLTGAPEAPTPAAGDNSERIATTAFVKRAVDVPLGWPTSGEHVWLSGSTNLRLYVRGGGGGGGSAGGIANGNAGNDGTETVVAINGQQYRAAPGRGGSGGAYRRLRGTAPGGAGGAGGVAATSGGTSGESGTAGEDGEVGATSGDGGTGGGEESVRGSGGDGGTGVQQGGDFSDGGGGGGGGQGALEVYDVAGVPRGAIIQVTLGAGGDAGQQPQANTGGHAGRAGMAWATPL